MANNTMRNLCCLLVVATTVKGFHLRSSKRINTIVFSSTVNDGTKEKKPVYIKNEREQIAKKKDFYRGAGVFRDVKAEVTGDIRKQFDSELMNRMKDSPNYRMEKDGIEFYLAKDHGFCWGGQ